MLFPMKVRTSLLLYWSGGSDRAWNSFCRDGESVGNTTSMSASDIESWSMVRMIVQGSANISVPDAMFLEANAPRPFAAEGRTSYKGGGSLDIVRQSES